MAHAVPQRAPKFLDEMPTVAREPVTGRVTLRRVEHERPPAVHAPAPVVAREPAVARAPRREARPVPRATAPMPPVPVPVYREPRVVVPEHAPVAFAPQPRHEAAPMPRAPEPPAHTPAVQIARMPVPQPPQQMFWPPPPAIRMSVDDLPFDPVATLQPLPQARGVRHVGGYVKHSAPAIAPARWKLSQLVLPLIACLAVLAIGFGVGAYVERQGHDAEPARAGATITAAAAIASAPAAPPVPVAAPAVVVTPIVEPVPPPQPTIIPNTVRLESTPPGATVTLVDRGTTVFLGTTPIATSLDPTRTHELVFTLEGHRTRVMKLDPSTMPALAASLEPIAETIAADRDADEAAPSEPAEPPRKKSKRKRGKGVLMVSTKPPCEIFIDGKSTNLMTPQRSLSVRAGRREIKLVNAEHGISRRMTVTIEANESTKLIRDFLNDD